MPGLPNERFHQQPQSHFYHHQHTDYSALTDPRLMLSARQSKMTERHSGNRGSPRKRWYLLSQAIDELEQSQVKLPQSTHTTNSTGTPQEHQGNTALQEYNTVWIRALKMAHRDRIGFGYRDGTSEIAPELQNLRYSSRKSQEKMVKSGVAGTSAWRDHEARKEKYASLILCNVADILYDTSVPSELSSEFFALAHDSECRPCVLCPVPVR